MLSAAPGRAGHTKVRLTLGSLLAGFFIVALPSTAHAELCEVDVGNNEIGLVDCDTLPGNSGDDGGDPGGGGPSCTIPPGHNACLDGKSCLLRLPAVHSAEWVTDRIGPPPAEDYIPAWRDCEGEENYWFWAPPGEQGPSTADLAVQAFGHLPFPTFAPTFNPPERTVVNLPTWWWAEGATDGELSASAGGVSVTAAPSHMTVETGDGTVLTCDFATTMTDECSHVYRRGSPGYQARMRLVWSVEFTDGGTVIESPGLPVTFESPWAGVTVPVTEIQTLVKPNR